MKILKKSVWITLILIMLSQIACSKEVTFHGKVVDADTLKPIKGALVLAIWRKTRAVLITSTTDFKEAKETLTDKNGEWSITGPEGDENKAIPSLLYYIGVWVTQDPEIIIYKPGYRKGIRGGFSAYPYINRKYDLEGIVLVRVGETNEERAKYHKRFGDFLPFIPVKDPEKKLKDLKFSFEYTENVKTIGRDKETNIIYHVVGIKKAKTRKERLEAMSCLLSGKKLPLSSKMETEERKRLFGPSWRNKQ